MTKYYGTNLTLSTTKPTRSGYTFKGWKNSKGELGRDASQTLVGLANGSQTVTSTTSLSLTFEVDEKRNVVATRVWNPDEQPPEEPIDPPEEEEDPPVIYRLDPEAEEEIPEEPVPLAAPVVTGDNSIVWVIAIAMAMLMLLAINLPMAKRPRGKHEAI